MIEGLVAANGQFNNVPGQLGSSDVLEINEWTNPVRNMTRRLIGTTANGRPVHTTEILQATIHPWHITGERHDFTSDFVYDYLGGVWGMDDRGHILGSAFGGLGGTNYYILLL